VGGGDPAGRIVQEASRDLGLLGEPAVGGGDRFEQVRVDPLEVVGGGGVAGAVGAELQRRRHWERLDLV